jgi:hypothetical protein
MSLLSSHYGGAWLSDDYLEGFQKVEPCIHTPKTLQCASSMAVFDVQSHTFCFGERMHEDAALITVSCSYKIPNLFQ